MALKQAEIVAKILKEKFSEYKFEIKGIVTSGDRLKTWPQKQAKGLFVKELEEALIKERIDLAVHSMKDLPVEMPQGLEIAAITKRIKANDILISRDSRKLSELKKGGRIGTSSPRRKMQLLLVRPDLKVIEIRGNLDTRIKKLRRGDCDAIILAEAGIMRLGLSAQITERLGYDIMLPAPAQGALGIQIRKNDVKIKSIVKKLNSAKTAVEVTAEREFLHAMGGGCRVPIGALHGAAERDVG